jgi:hypothetical protein
MEIDSFKVHPIDKISIMLNWKFLFNLLVSQIHQLQDETWIEILNDNFWASRWYQQDFNTWKTSSVTSM